jgi:hypothetical protein
MSKSTQKNAIKTKFSHPGIQPIKPISVQSLKNDLVLGFLLFVFTLAVYQPVWNGAMIWDDDQHITRPELRSMHGLVRIWTQLGTTAMN